MWIASATLLLFAAAAGAMSASRSATPFDLLDDGSVVVSVTIDGTGPYRFVIDTGSSRTVISRRLWKTLRLPVLAKTEVVTPAGRDMAYVVRRGGLTIDGRPGVNLTAAVIPADRYAAGQRVDGLIGQDLLADLVYTIDYEDHAIIWHGPGELLPGRRLPLSIRNDRLLVSLDQRDGDANPLSLVPDSGSDALVLFAHAQSKLQLTPGEVGVLTSVSGSRLVRRVEVEALRVGSARLRNPLTVVIDTRESVEMMGDGLLPLNVFSRVTFNVAEGYLIVQSR